MKALAQCSESERPGSWHTTKKQYDDAHRTPGLMAYVINKYSWSINTIKTVNWASINSVRRNLSDTK